MKYDVITFGSATLDIFLKTKDFVFKKERSFVGGEGVCFPFGLKEEIEEVCFASGGGGANVAATFASQGLMAAYCGRIGKDFAGDKTLSDLKRFKASRELVLTTEKKATNVSVIFSFKEPARNASRSDAGGDRTCFVWRGASEELTWVDLDKEKLEAKWFYLAPLAGRLSLLFEPLVNFAKKNKIKVFANLGHAQIKMEKSRLGRILKKIDVLLLNQEEASLLTGLSYAKDEKVFSRLFDLTQGLAIITKGDKGAVASDGKFIWEVKTLPVRMVEKTGAGDAFGSGFLSGLIRTSDMEYALRFGIANAVSCIKKAGAKEGLLKAGEPFLKARIKKMAL